MLDALGRQRTSVATGILKHITIEKKCVSALFKAFNLQNTAQPTSSTLPYLLVFHQSPAFVVWMSGDRWQPSALH